MRKAYLNSYILFLIWPFLTLLTHSKSYKSKLFLNIIWAFFVFYGYVLVSNIEGTDVFRYSEWFKDYASSPLSTGLSIFDESVQLDFFRPFSFWFVSLFSSNPRVYFAFIGLVYGYFYSRILGLLFKHISVQINLLNIWALLSYLFILSFYSVQFVRFSTATVIFVYFVLKHFETKSTSSKYLYLSATAILVHFSFVLPVFIVYLHRFLPKIPILYFGLFFITSFVQLFDFDFLKNLLEAYMPTALESKKSYLNEDYAAQVSEISGTVNWYIKYHPIIMKTALLSLLLIAFSQLERNSYLKDKQGLLLFALLLGSVGNITSAIPSGFRYLSVAYHLLWFVAVPYAINFVFGQSKHYLLKYVLVGIFIFHIVVGMRYATDTISVDFLFSNPVLVLFEVFDQPIIDFIKSILG